MAFESPMGTNSELDFVDWTPRKKFPTQFPGFAEDQLRYPRLA